MKWFRFYSEFRSDPKMRRMPVAHRYAFIVLLCLANDNSSRGEIKGLDDDDIAYELEMDKEDWLTLKSKFKAKGLIDIVEGGLTICNWSKRQFASDSSAERVAKHRSKAKKRDCNVTETEVKRHVTPPDTDTESEADPKERVTSPSSTLERENEKSSNHGRSDFVHEQNEAEEENCNSVPQPIFSRRQPRFLSSAPVKQFQGPWGVGHTPELDRFCAWLTQKAIARRYERPDSWAIGVINKMNEGGPRNLWYEFEKAEAGEQIAVQYQGPTICEALKRDLKVDDPLSGYGGSEFRSFFNGLGYTFDSRSAAFKRKYASYPNLDEFIELAIYNGVIQKPSPDWFPTHQRSELEALVA